MGCVVSSAAQPSPAQPSGPRVIVGPVVGAVTGDTARILLEVDADCEITPRFRAGPRKEEVTYALTALTPTVLTLTDLDPGFHYSVQFEGAHPQRAAEAARFTTPLPGKTAPHSLRIAAVSCNKVLWDRQGEPDVWEQLAERCAAGEVDLVLHMGDQVYGDSDHVMKDEDGNRLDATVTDVDGADGFEKHKTEGMSASAYVQGMALLEGLAPPAWPSKSEAIRELYRNAYRRTWSKDATATVLCSQPNAMVMDDHEITDDWGDSEEDRSVANGSPPTTHRNFVALRAFEVYREYQMSLREDIGISTSPPAAAKGDQQLPPTAGLGPPAFSLFTFHGSVGIAMLDLRACHSFLADGSEQARPYLGDDQWAQLTAALSSEGQFAACTSLLVCSPVPMALVNENLAKKITELGFAEDTTNDLFGGWSLNGLQELPLLLSALDEWQAQTKERKVTLLGGDIHFGFISEVLKARRPSSSGSSSDSSSASSDASDDDGSEYVPVFRQLITSAVHNEPPPGGPIATWLLSGANAVANAHWGDAAEGAQICPGWSVDHRKGSTMARSNFGVVTIADTEKKPHTLELIAASGHSHTG
jgi:hypothetical protein